MKAFFREIGRRLINFLYNEDRAIASIGGAPAQETISAASEIHKANPVVDVLEDGLNKIQPGHTVSALEHARALEAADKALEGK